MRLGSADRRRSQSERERERERERESFTNISHDFNFISSLTTTVDSVLCIDRAVYRLHIHRLSLFHPISPLPGR